MAIQIDLKDYDFELPMELVARNPTESRETCRLLHLNRTSGKIEHTTFSQIGQFLRSGDLIVLNDTRVIRGKFFAHRPDGGRVEINLFSRGDGDNWIFIIRPTGKLRPGMRLVGDGVPLEVTLVGPYGPVLWEGAFDQEQTTVFSTLENFGEMPLPLYITLGNHSDERYQTVYAEKLGATQAPTAGLHFTHPLMKSLEKQGIKFTRITLHVGMSTYVDPKQAIVDKRMYREWVELTPAAAEDINSATGRVIAVGTTVVRSLESVATARGRVKPFTGWTDLFISPGYEFQIVQALITNFHQPMSTRVLLVAAFANREQILHAYRQAIEKHYMFYDFGDAMFIS